MSRRPASPRAARRRLARRWAKALERRDRATLGPQAARLRRRSYLATASTLALTAGLPAAAGAVQAPTVTATLAGGVLTVTGDGDANTIAITCSSGVRVNGFAPTILNGVDSCESVTGISVAGSGGADRIDLAGVGAGYSQLSIASLSARISLDGGAGDDTLVPAPSTAPGAWLTNDQHMAARLFGNRVTTGMTSIEAIDAAVPFGLDASGFSGPTTLDGAGAASGGVAITGGAGIDSIVGGVANDTITGGPGGNDVLSGGAGGQDVLVHQFTGGASLYGDSLVSTSTDLLTSFERASITGSSGNDQLSLPFVGGVQTWEGTVSFDALGGNDTMNTGLDADTFLGGSGTDTFTIQQAGTGTLTDTSWDYAGTDSLNAIERASITATDAGPTIDASGFGGPVTINGGSGADDFTTSASLEGSYDGAGGVDVLRRTTTSSLRYAADSIVGVADSFYEGFDTVVTAAGSDGLRIDVADQSGVASVDGATGSDTLVGGVIGDSLDGNGGADTYGIRGDGSISPSDTGANVGPSSTVFEETPTVVLAAGNGGDDTLFAQYTTRPFRAEGGGGNDGLYGGALADTLAGGAGDDVLQGRAGADSVDGGADSDSMSDTIAGAGGLLTDTTYGDGSGTTDTIASIERGSFAADRSMDASAFSGTVTLNATGAAVPVTLAGGAGDDSITGSPQDDVLSGGGGDDQLDGGAGTDALRETGLGGASLTPPALTSGGDTDTLAGLERASLTGTAGGNLLDASAVAFPVALDGGAGDDSLTGGSGPDTLTSGTGLDTLTGGGGNDDLRAQFSTATTLGCGTGSDSVLRDLTLDLVGADCETVTPVAPPPAPPDPPPAPAPEAPAGPPSETVPSTAPPPPAAQRTLTIRALRTTKGRTTATLVLRCPAPGTCATTVTGTYRKGTRTLPAFKTWRQTIPGAATPAITLRLSSAAARELRAKRRLVVTVTVALRGGATLSRAVSFRR